MGLDRYRLLAQLGAGSDGISYRAEADGDGRPESDATEVEVRELSRARAEPGRWGRLVPRLRLATGLAHPAIVRVIDADLGADPPYVALEWGGTRTIAEGARARRGSTDLAGVTASRAEVIENIRILAGALEEAHRLGLAHGRLGPGRVFLVDGWPKLDFTGVDAGFPVGSASSRALDADCLDPRAGADPSADRAADLYSLGVLCVWMLTGQTGQTDRELCIAGLDSSPMLGALIRDLLADDPADRPTAAEVLERLSASIAQFQPDATGDWDNTGASRERAALSLPSGAFELRVDIHEPRTLVLDAGRPRLGRYRLLDKLGEGGQGIVYRAEDPAEGTIVAIKVLRANRAGDAPGLRRFRKEARLMAEANNPHVVNLLEYNEEDGIPYLVLEFVAGDSLAQLLNERSRLDESEALAIMAGVARGLMAAHDRGIVHRDIKPSNILLLPTDPSPSPIAGSLSYRLEHGTGPASAFGPESSEFNATRVLESIPGGRFASSAQGVPRIKISDFGLARHVVDTESMALTAAGALMGTPHYMAPEQWTGRAIDARTDVYAMGATLFHLLSGRPPFESRTRDDLATQHCNEPPPPLSTLNATVSEGVVRVIERALAKRPEDRYIDAGAMLRDLEALLHGEAIGIPMHPILPAYDPKRALRFEFRWELEAAPRQLWPFVTNTDRLDRAIGFPPMKYSTRFEPGRGVRTFAEGRKAGMIEVGEEHPYEWVEPRRMGVLREYSQGPFVWLVSVVELIPRPGGGTILVHHIDLEPSNWKIRVGSRWGVGVSLRKRLEGVYRRIDATVKGQARRGAAVESDPFAEPERLPAPRQLRLDRLLDRLAERGVDAAVIERLGDHLARGSAQEVARIRPIALADRFALDPDQVVAACLLGAREGLLELHWDILCPVCRISCQVTDTLRAIAEHGHCTACHLDFELDFANSIELIFRVHPEVREADLGTYCVGGPAHSPHVPAQVRLAPGERIELELELPEGVYRLRGPQLPWTVDFTVRGSTGLRRCEIDLTPGLAPENPAGMRAGNQVMVLSNGHDRELLVRVERTASRSDALTAARAASSALFRELFPGELLAPGQLATVSMVTFLVTALDTDQADALYQSQGDARAFGVIHEHFRRLGDAIRDGGGAVVKTQGDGVVASFGDVTAAVRTALELSSCLAVDASTRPLRLRIGVHRGPTLAATLNDQLDYFGATARQAAGTLQYARGDEMILTRAVAADPEVATLLNERQIATEVVPAALGGQTHVIRLRLENRGRSESIP
jgi:eukaryotic-like serine/threonine-protein kinase